MCNPTTQCAAIFPRPTCRGRPRCLRSSIRAGVLHNGLIAGSASIRQLDHSLLPCRLRIGNCHCGALALGVSVGSRHGGAALGCLGVGRADGGALAPRGGGGGAYGGCGQPSACHCAGGRDSGGAGTGGAAGGRRGGLGVGARGSTRARAHCVGLKFQNVFGNKDGCRVQVVFLS